MKNVLKTKFSRRDTVSVAPDIAQQSKMNQDLFKEQFDRFEWRIEQIEDLLNRKFDALEVKIINFENAYSGFKADVEESMRKDKLNFKNFQSEVRELGNNSQKHHRQIMDIA